MSTTLDASQTAAVDLMLSASFGLVTGPPGSGKTTTLRAALDALDAAGKTYACAAPTGKAARRMEQATGRSASTLHRLLAWTRGFWAVCEAAPLDVDVVFVDEASMIDYELGRALMAGACKSRVVLVGDADQLPPVGVGRLFGDLVGYGGAVPVARLTTQHRAAAESWVVRNAPRVLTGGPLEIAADAPGFHGIVCDDARAVPAVVRDWVQGLAGHDPVVLAPQYQGPAGVDALNVALDPVCNQWSPRPEPDEPQLRRDPLPIRRGTRVMQTRNDYDLDLMNGELGVVVNVDPDARGPVTVEFPELGRVVTMTRKETASLQVAYAMTVHKTQGSEFGHVVVVCHSTHTHMLSRGILYTALTRAKQHVTLVYDRRGLATALRTPSDARNTSLVERLDAALPDTEVPT